jgi:hypothetical protein
VISVNGRIDLFRTRWFDPGQGSDCPLDRLVDESQATVSVGVRQLCVREGSNARSFVRGRENLKHAAQIDVGEELFRQIVENEGKAVLKASGQEQLELDWSASDCKAQRPQGQQTTRLYVSADGVMVPTITQEEKDKRREVVLAKRRKMPRQQRGRLRRLRAVKKGTDQRYKQMYLTSFYDQEQKHRLVGVTRGKVKGLKQLLGREAARVHLRAAAERVGVVDGAVCLRNTLENLPLEAILLDFYHLSEHVGEAAVKTLGAETAACKQWLEDVLHAARHDGYKLFFQKLMDWRSQLRGQKRQVADQLINYVALRQEMILYDRCDQHDWNVGSGPMESMCGVTTDRVKGRGRRWDMDNAEAMMALEALYQSTGLWDKYWANALYHLN